MTAIFSDSPTAVAQNLTGRNYVSYSALTTYMACPLRYFFRYVEGLPERAISSSLAFGSGVHSALELWFNERLRGHAPPSHDELLRAFWECWHSKGEGTAIEFGKAEDLNSIAQLADRVVKAFCESDLADPDGVILGVEEELRVAFVSNVPDVLARIDLIVETDEALVVKDFKTAKSRLSRGQADDQAEQLLIYGELAGRLAPDKDLRLEFAVISKTKNPTVESHAVHADPKRTGRTKRIVQSVWKAIAAEHFYPAPSPINCPRCPYREPCRKWTG